MIVNQFPDRKIETENGKFLYFGGTAYLGLPTNKAFQKIILQNLKKWGTAFGSSRNANVQLSAYETGELYLAKFIQSESALTVSSGILAGKLAIETLGSLTNCFFHFPNIHNAIKAQNSLPFFIEKKLNPRLLDNLPEKITILTDSVPSFSVFPIDFSVLKQISTNKEITLVIDESHSLGILGENGCGIFSSINLPNLKRKIKVSSLGKALGITGGVIASDHEFIYQIKQQDSFVSGAGMNPAFVQSFSETKKIYEKQHKKLQKNLKYINQTLTNKNINFDKSYPLLYSNIENIYEILKANKIIITHFPYPNDSGELNRIVITANHKKKDLYKLVTILNQL